MGIPEAQLKTWSHQGSITQSSTTYNGIKRVLESTAVPYSNKNYEVFLQGSYQNATNIYAESDVDIVIRLNDCFHGDIDELSDDQRRAYQEAYSSAAYGYHDFRQDVLSVLKAEYRDVEIGNKALHVAASGSRRSADVIVAVQFRRYYEFLSVCNQSYEEGMCFFDPSGKRIVNYPRQHSTNCKTKHQNTEMRFKPVVRMFKNIRGKLVKDRLIARDVAPSYYIEGLLYNVPDHKFTTGNRDYLLDFLNCIDWIQQADRTKFVCANRQYPLLEDNSPVTWRAVKCKKFLQATVELWNQW